MTLPLTEKECHFITALVLLEGLSRAGICQNMPRAVLYGAFSHQGIGLRNLYTIMGLQQLQALLDNLWKNIITGKLLRISLEPFKLELGIQESIFKLNYEQYKNLGTNCWIKQQWIYL